MVVAVRAAVPEDAEAIATVEVRAWQAAYQRSVGPRYLGELSTALRADVWREWITGPGPLIHCTVAEVDGAVAGACALAPAGDTLQLQALYVDPARWRSGIGGALFGDGLARHAAEPWNQVDAWLFLHNAVGRSAFARLGFRLEGSRRQHAETHADEVLLRKLR
jgi:RimJ/RimL family protein N-acetyltransferase